MNIREQKSPLNIKSLKLIYIMKKFILNLLAELI